MKRLPQQGKDDWATWRISRSYSGLITESRFPPVPLKDSESKTLSSSNTGKRNFYRIYNWKMDFWWRTSRALKLCIYIGKGWNRINLFDGKTFPKDVIVRFPSQHHLINYSWIYLNLFKETLFKYITCEKYVNQNASLTMYNVLFRTVHVQTAHCAMYLEGYIVKCASTSCTRVQVVQCTWKGDDLLRWWVFCKRRSIPRLSLSFF